MDSFISISENVTCQIIEKKSKFIANFFYVENIEEIENITNKIKKKYFDARHNCLAFRVIKADGEIIEKASDDGEPSKTAGAPMLKILQSKDLCNVLIIVTRYFGGTLLGTGGLVRAYSDSLITAINNATKIKKIIGEEVKLEFSYNNFEKFKYYCEKNGINVTNVNYLTNINCIAEIEKGMLERILRDFVKIGIKIGKYEILNKRFITRYF